MPHPRHPRPSARRGGDQRGNETAARTRYYRHASWGQLLDARPGPVLPTPPGLYLRRGLRSVGRRVDGDVRVELDTELVLDGGGWDEPASVQPHGAKRPAPDQVADAGFRHAHHLGHFAGPVGHALM